MTPNGWLQIGLFALLVLLLTKPVGIWLYRVFETRARPLPRVLGPVERLLFRLCGVDPDREQDWKGYTVALLALQRHGSCSSPTPSSGCRRSSRSTRTAWAPSARTWPGTPR